MESFEQKIKERNNLMKAQVDALTGRNELVEVVDTLLKAGVAEEDLVEKAKYIRKESDGKGGYKYIYEELKEKNKKDLNGNEWEGNYSSIIEKIADKAKNGKLTQEEKNLFKNYNHLTEKELSDLPESVKDKLKKIAGLSENKMKTDKPEKYTNLDQEEYSKRFNSEAYKKHKADYLKNTEKPTKKNIEDAHNYAMRHPETVAAGKNKQKSESSDLEKAETDKKKKKVAKVMKEFKAGTLKTSAGDLVTNSEQALAIAMSEAGISKKD